jgi:hypothetical protein
MTSKIDGTRGEIIIPKLDPMGIDNNLKLPGIRNVIQANFGNVLQAEGTAYSYTRELNDDGSESFVETAIPVYIISAYNVNGLFDRTITDYVDIFNAATSVSCTGLVYAVSFTREDGA